MNKEEESYKFLIDYFTEDVIEKRFENMLKRAEDFLVRKNLDQYVYINKSILHAVLLDYFTDIWRLKKFEEIKYANKNKITAYMSYWWLRRKPMQLKETAVIKEDLVYVNELFVASLIIKDMVVGRDSNIISETHQYEELLKHIKYYLKYRLTTAQNLELILLAFNSGIEIGEIISNSNNE